MAGWLSWTPATERPHQLGLFSFFLPSSVHGESTIWREVRYIYLPPKTQKPLTTPASLKRDPLHFKNPTFIPERKDDSSCTVILLEKRSRPEFLFLSGSLSGMQ
jgi:hypothetical protein